MDTSDNERAEQIRARLGTRLKDWGVAPRHQMAADIQWLLSKYDEFRLKALDKEQ